MSRAIDCSQHQRRFLAAFAASGSIIQAARWSKLNRAAHYNWLKEDPTYRPRFDAAQLEAARTLEDEAVRRAHQGLKKAVYYKGRIVGYESEYSDTLMLALLKANAPDKFRDRVSMDHKGDVDVNLTVNAGEILRSRIAGIAERKRA